MPDSYRTVAGTPEKHKNPEDGYQSVPVGQVGRVPAMDAERIRNPSRRGAEDISRTPVKGTVFDDAD